METQKLKISFTVTDDELRHFDELGQVPHFKWLYNKLHTWSWRCGSRWHDLLVGSWWYRKWGRWTDFDKQTALFKSVSENITKEIDAMIIEDLLKQFGPPVDES